MGGGCCGILVGDIFIIITNLCQKYHIRDRGGGTGGARGWGLFISGAINDGKIPIISRKFGWLGTRENL